MVKIKIILVHIGAIDSYPPVLSISKAFNDLGHKVFIISTNISEEMANLFVGTQIELVSISVDLGNPTALIIKLKRMLEIRRKIWMIIDKLYDQNSLIWISHIEAIKHIGKRIYNKRYTVHLFELFEKLYYSHRTPFLSIDLSKICNCSQRVIVSEYNRAYISMCKLQLKELPAIIPNKPYYNIKFEKNSGITTSNDLKSFIERLVDKKIIIYQGLISPERPLEKYINAVNKLGDDYVFIIMSSGKNIYDYISSKNYHFIPYITPPYHLEVTSHAYIGVLTYTPIYVKNFSSPLNAIYCAPNKLYEYSMFGIPMIGSDIPGLSLPFNKYGCGICIGNYSEKAICDAIIEIDNNYSDMSTNSKLFYKNTNIKEILNNDIIKHS